MGRNRQVRGDIAFKTSSYRIKRNRDILRWCDSEKRYGQTFRVKETPSNLKKRPTRHIK
jgi:hypothetical protein